MRKVELKKLLAFGFISCLVATVASAAPQSSNTPLYTVSDVPGACNHAINTSPVATDCDIASMDQADFSAGAQVLYPDFISSFTCTGIPQIQAIHTWTAFFSQAGTHFFRDVFNGGILGRHPMLKATLYGIDLSGVTNNGVPLPYGTSESRLDQGHADTLLAVAKVFRGALQTMLSGFNPLASGGTPTCVVDHPGQIFKHIFENPQYITTNPLSGLPNDWWGSVAHAVTSAMHDPANPNALCVDPNSPLAQYVKDYIECV